MPRTRTRTPTQTRSTSRTTTVASGWRSRRSYIRAWAESGVDPLGRKHARSGSPLKWSISDGCSTSTCKRCLGHEQHHQPERERDQHRGGTSACARASPRPSPPSTAAYHDDPSRICSSRSTPIQRVRRAQRTTPEGRRRRNGLRPASGRPARTSASQRQRRAQAASITSSPIIPQNGVSPVCGAEHASTDRVPSTASARRSSVARRAIGHTRQINAAHRNAVAVPRCSVGARSRRSAPGAPFHRGHRQQDQSRPAPQMNAAISGPSERERHHLRNARRRGEGAQMTDRATWRLFSPRRTSRCEK